MSEEESERTCIRSPLRSGARRKFCVGSMMVWWMYGTIDVFVVGFILRRLKEKVASWGISRWVGSLMSMMLIPGPPL